MPRNDQVTRQWYLLRELGSGKGLTLREMRQRLPEEIQRHDRTLRRDIEALEAAGFPITTNSINGQTRWKLIEGFHQVPALSFSPTELMSLAFSRNLLKPLEGTAIQASLSSALNKAAAALPPQGVDYVHEMERAFQSDWDLTNPSGSIELRLIALPRPSPGRARRRSVTSQLLVTSPAGRR